MQRPSQKYINLAFFQALAELAEARRREQSLRNMDDWLVDESVVYQQDLPDVPPVDSCHVGHYGHCVNSVNSPQAYLDR